MYTTFLLLFFQIFKVYSRYVSSSSVAGLCLFAKREVKSLSKVDWTSLCFFRMFLKWFTHLTSTKAQSLFISAVGMPLRSQRLKLFPVVQHFFNVTCWHSSLFIAVLLLWWALFIFLVSFLIQLLFQLFKIFCCQILSPLCDVVSLFLCHTRTRTHAQRERERDGKDKLLEWPDCSC